MSEIVDIFDVSYEGAGVGKIDGQVVFVPKTLPGERVAVEIIKKSESFLIGRVVEILRQSVKRCLPFCPYFEICGGCAFQHCGYDEEISLKSQILAKELNKAGWSEKVDFVKSPNRFFYRNKIKLEVCNGKIGYFKPKSHDFFEVKSCPIAGENINKIIPLIETFIAENDCQGLKNVYIKEIGGNVAICFLFGKNVKKVQKNIKKMQIFRDFLVFFAFGEVLESNRTKVFKVNGTENLCQNFGDFVADVEISAFNQVNDEVAKLLYDFVLDKVSGKVVVNAYSGQGVLTRLMTKNAKFVYGVEVQSSAHESAEKLANSKMKNICAKVEDVLDEILSSTEVDTIVLDPAREGCKKSVLESILKKDIREIIYISCNFSTLVRDLKILSEKYGFDSVTAFDMFPCTSTIETVVILQKK